MKVPNPIALIGDNLAAHFSEEAIGKCMKENIRYVLLIMLSHFVIDIFYLHSIM